MSPSWSRAKDRGEDRVKGLRPHKQHVVALAKRYPARIDRRAFDGDDRSDIVVATCQCIVVVQDLP
jgi:hypothetical protein